MTNGLSWLDRAGSLSWRNRDILFAKIAELTRNLTDFKSKVTDLLNFIEEQEVKLQQLLEKKKRYSLAANHIVELKKLEEKINRYQERISKAHDVLNEFGDPSELIAEKEEELHQMNLQFNRSNR